MKRILSVFAFVALALGVASCVKDKGHYDYTPLNEPQYNTSNDIQRTWRGLTGDEVNIESTVTLNPDEEWAHEWYETTDNKKDVISHEKVLKLFIPEGTHTYRYRVQNVRTGIWYLDTKTYTTISSGGDTRQGGLVFLTQEGTSIGIDMLAAPVSQWQQDWRLYKSDALLGDLNIPEADRVDIENRKALSLVSVNNSTEHAPDLLWKQMWVVTDRGTFNLNRNFSKGMELSSAIANYSVYDRMSLKPTKMVNSVIQGSGDNSLAFYVPRADQNGGDWFWAGFRSNPTGSGYFPFENAVNIYREDYGNSLGKEIAGLSDKVAFARSYYMVFMWHPERAQFLVKGGFTGVPQNSAETASSRWLVDEGELPTNTEEAAKYVAAEKDPTVAEAAAFKLNVPGRKLLFMDSRDSNMDLWAVVNDPGVGYQFLSIRATQPYNVFKQFAVTMPSSTQIGNAKFVAAGVEANGSTYANYWKYLYYVTNDNRVFYSTVHPDLATGEGELTDLIVPEGHEVVAFKTFSAEYFTSALRPMQNNSNMQGAVSCNSMIYVVTKDPKLPEDSCCTLTAWVLYTGNPTPAVAEYKPLIWDETNQKDKPAEEVTAKPMRWSGLGNVVDFGWKTN